LINGWQIFHALLQIVTLGQKLRQTLEEFKSWSQNLGHEDVLTTLYSSNIGTGKFSAIKTTPFYCKPRC
jgi:uncharacterized protein (DUF1697 family)